MDSLKAHKSSTRSTSIHNITNANTIVNKYYWYWLRLGDGERKGEEKRRFKQNFTFAPWKESRVSTDRELRTPYKATRLKYKPT